MGIKTIFMAAVLIFGATGAWASTLDTVKERGVLMCGTDDTAPGFGYLNPQTGHMEGIDVDLCRAVAAAVLGDEEKVKIVHVTAKSRFTALQANLVDVIFDYTTVLAVRESSIGIDFLPIYFWDGTGAMVKTEANIKSLTEMEGGTLCTVQGTGNETIIANFIKSHGWGQTPVLTYDTLEKLFAALEAGRCNAMITDKSSLAAYKGHSSNPAAFSILPETLEKSPFAGFVIENDSKWRDALSWVIYALFQAEESGINKENVNSFKDSKDPFVRKFLGTDGNTGHSFGLGNNFVFNVISQVGNYADIYDRNVGPNTNYTIPRDGTANASAKNGGLLVSPVW